MTVDPLLPAKVKASDAFQDVGSGAAGSEDIGALPDRKHDTPIGAAHDMRASRRVDHQSPGRVRAVGVDLRAVKNKDVFVALMLMVWNARSWRVTKQRRGGPAVVAPIQAVDLDTWTKIRPLEACIENALA